MREPMRPVSVTFVASILSLLALGCRDGGDTKTPLSAAVPQGSATVPAFARTGAPAEPARTEPPAAEASADAAPSEADGDGDDSESGDAAADASAAAAADDSAPLPDVEVKNVGMHIGGEDNSAESKRPIRAEVAKQYDAMKRCYAKAEAPGKGVTFGVDMRILGEGGHPKIENPRTGLKGAGVKECLVKAFESVEFPRQPKGAPRMVSFSIEFRPKK